MRIATCFILSMMFACEKDPIRTPSKSHFVGQKSDKLPHRLVIFVHGVLGDADSTWKNSETGTFWPKLLKDDSRAEDADVFVYSYASPAIGLASNVYEIANRMGQELKDREFFEYYDQLYFVSHSMGGLVVKRVLLNLYSAHETALLRRVRAALFISTPAEGADVASLATWLSVNPQFVSMSPDKAADYLQSTEGDWQSLMAARDSDQPFPRAFCAYETQKTHGKVIVPRLYTSKFCDGRIIGFDYDHSQIVKPADSESDVFLWAIARIREARDYKVQPLPPPNSLKVGHSVLLDGFQHFDDSGLSFASRSVVPYDSLAADLLVSNMADPNRQSNALFFTRANVYPYEDAKQDIGANGGMIKISASELSEVHEAPDSGYLSHWFKVRAGGVYCVRARDGLHFAKLKVTDLQDDRIGFDWVYQANQTRLFDGN